MLPARRFRLVFGPDAIAHLQAIERKDDSLIRATINEQLHTQPDIETRNIKPLEVPTPFGAAWELRLGPGNRFSVFYEVDLDEGTVRVLAFGVKRGSRLVVGGEEIGL